MRKITQSTIPNHSFLTSTITQSLKKIGQEMLKTCGAESESLTDRRMDGWLDGWMDGFCVSVWVDRWTDRGIAGNG